MSRIDVIRAWKDEQYRLGLTEEQRRQLPAHPAGLIELSDDELEPAAGGETSDLLSFGCCTPIKSYGVCTYRVLTIGCCDSEQLP